jgi:hypothetical protein
MGEDPQMQMWWRIDRMVRRKEMVSMGTRTTRPTTMTMALRST